MQKTNSPGRLPDIRRTIEIKAKMEKVWQAVATSDGIANWLMPNDFQAKIGHEFTLQTNFGPTPCKVQELDPPSRLSFTWDNFGWVISFELIELNDKTQFTVIHSGWGEADELVPKSNEKQSVIRDRMYEGWGYLTEGLRDKLDKDDE